MNKREGPYAVQENFYQDQCFGNMAIEQYHFERQMHGVDRMPVLVL